MRLQQAGFDVPDVEPQPRHRVSLRPGADPSIKRRSSDSTRSINESTINVTDMRSRGHSSRRSSRAVTRAPRPRYEAFDTLARLPEQLSGEWPYRYAPGTLDYALEQTTALAAEGSQWPAQHEATFRAAAAATGGYWVLAQCEQWLEGSGMPAWQPARVLTQLAFYLVDESEGYRERLYALHTPAAAQPDKPAAVLVEKPVNEVSVSHRLCHWWWLLLDYLQCWPVQDNFLQLSTVCCSAGEFSDVSEWPMPAVWCAVL